MPYFVLQTPRGTVEVFADSLQQAIELAGGNDPGMQVYAHPAFPPSGTAQPSAPHLPAVGFRRDLGLPGVPGGAPQAQPGTPGYVSPNAERDLQIGNEIQYPYGAFVAGLAGRGLNTEGPLGGILRDQYAPSRAAFQFQQLLRGTPAEPDPSASYQAYLQKMGPNAYTNAANVFGQVAGGAPFGAPGVGQALTRAGLGDDANARAIRDEFGNLARGAATSRYGIAAGFLPGDEAVGRGFNQQLYEQAQRGPGAQGVSYVDYLRRQFGL